MEIGSKLPSVPVQQFADGDIKQIDLSAHSAGKTMVLVSVPGAFTPTCSDDHVPGYIANLDSLKAKGVDEIVVVASNDFFAVKAWADSFNAPEGLSFMADGSQKFAAAVGQTLDLTDLGLGLRSQRYAAVVEDGVVKSFAVEPDPGAVAVSGAAEVLKGL